MKHSHITSIITIAAVASLSLAASPTHHDSHAHQAITLEQIKSKILPMSLKSVASITKATESGDKKTALKELAHLQAMLKQIQTIINKQVKSSLANTKCPIMGQTIDPKQGPDHLTREYKGQKIGFVLVEDLETLGHYADWLEIPTQRIRELNGFSFRRQIRAHQLIKIPLGKVGKNLFEERRYEHHKEIEEDFFSVAHHKLKADSEGNVSVLFESEEEKTFAILKYS